ncbi:hypothetical protein VTL71DRAFT_2999 [Oculimacula yallundae]|uniref:Uncharacterized protein n=1 Tax=Oculimacula yallundae TaxID=86028 RepID=A0ABR4C5Y9_9HELO
MTDRHWKTLSYRSYKAGVLGTAIWTRELSKYLLIPRQNLFEVLTSTAGEIHDLTCRAWFNCNNETGEYELGV